MAANAVLEINMRIKNPAQTPARHVRAVIHCQPCDDPETAKVRFLKTERRSATEIGGGSHGDIQLRSARPFTEVETDALRKKEKYLLIAAVVSYRDIFGRRHLSIARGYLHFMSDGRQTVNRCSRQNYGN